MAHNGGRSQVNFAGVAGLEYPFINHVLSGDGWRMNATTLLPSLVNLAGFPQSNPSTGLPTIIRADPLAERDDTWVLKWTGDGGLKLDPGAPGMTVLEGASFVSGGTNFLINTTGADGRVKFRFNGQGVGSFAIMTVNPANPFTSIALMRAAHEARYDSGEVWNPDFLSVLRTMRPGILRFLSYNGGAYQGTNGGVVVRWAHRSQPGDVNYGQDHWPSGIWGGTAGGTDTYAAPAASDTPGAWTHRELWQGVVTNPNTVTNPTLNIGARGAKTIKDERGNALSLGAISTTGPVTFMYDADLNAVLYFASGIGGGVPVELQVDLCNRIGAHGWFNLHHHAEDDYITQYAALVKARLDTGLRAYVEYSNEIWNFGAGFPQTSWAYNKGLAAGKPDQNNQPMHYWYAKRFKEMAALVESAFGAQTNYRLVIAVQGAGSGAQYDLYRFQGADLSGPPSAPNRPIDRAHCIASGTYFYGARCRQFGFEYANDANLTTLKSWADDYATGTGAQKEAAIASVDADVRDSSFSQDLAHFQTNGIWKTWHDLASTYGKKFVEYEAALAIAAPSPSDLTALGVDTSYSAKITNLFTAFKYHARANTLTLDRYRAFVAQANGEFPSQFIVAGSDEWASIPDLYGVPYEIYNAIVEFNAVSGPIGPGIPRNSLKIWHHAPA